MAGRVKLNQLRPKNGCFGLTHGHVLGESVDGFDEQEGGEDES
jgi:hypothetical protein